MSTPAVFGSLRPRPIRGPRRSGPCIARWPLRCRSSATPSRRRHRTELLPSRSLVKRSPSASAASTVPTALNLIRSALPPSGPSSSWPSIDLPSGWRRSRSTAKTGGEQRVKEAVKNSQRWANTIEREVFRSMPEFEFVLSICLGIGLAAACGFRVFVPLLGISTAAVAGQVHLAYGFEWLGTWPAFACFLTATILEIAAYYIPWIDNLLDSIATPAAVVAGTIITASVITDMSPLMQWTLAII